MNVDQLQRPRIDPRAFIAYWLDVDKGYRGAAQRCWRVVRLEEIAPAPNRWYERQAIDLTSTIEIFVDAPPLRIEPTHGGRLRISSDVRLVTQAYGEQLPKTTADGVVEVPYGSVVRAGPLLVAVLYAEQVESLAEGRIKLPFIGGTVNLVTDDGGLSDFVKPFEERSRTMRLWKGAFGASFVLSAAAAIVLVMFKGIFFCYGDSPLDAVAACVSCIFLAWTGLLTVGLPIQRAISGWLFTDQPADS